MTQNEHGGPSTRARSHQEGTCAMTPELPEDLTGLTDDELATLKDKLREAGEELRERALTDDSAASELEEIAEAFARIEDEMGRRDEMAQDRANRVSAAAGRLGLDDGEDAEGEGDPEEGAADVVEEPAEAAAATSEPATASADAPEADADADAAAVSADKPEAAAAEAPAPAASADENEAAATEEPSADAASESAESAADDGSPAVEAASTTGAEASEGDAPDTEPAAPAAADPAQEAEMTTKPVSDPVAGMTAERPDSVAPADGPGSGGNDRHLAIFRATANAGRDMIDRPLGVDDGGDPVEAGGRHALATLIHEKHKQLRSLGNVVGREPIKLASARTEFDYTLGEDIVENHAVIERLRHDAEPLVASGGNCAPLAPRYDVFSVAEPQMPVEQFLPGLGAPRGGIRYVQGVDWTDARAGVRVTTVEEDAAGYVPDGPTAVKPCVTFECPDVVECEVSAVSRCVTFGNLNYRTFPELIETHLDHLAVAFAEEKEITYLDAINDGSTVISGGIAYGAARSAYFTLALAMHAYRKRNRMGLSAPLQVLAPDSLAPFLAVDMVNDHSMGLGFLRESPETIGNEIFRALGGSVGWYYDGASTTPAGEQMTQAQAGGGAAINGWPCDYRVYIFAPGTWARLDGGTLDVGIVRDSDLNSTNDLQIFAEQWVQACRLGNESIALDLTLAANGTGPDPVTPVTTCTDYS